MTAAQDLPASNNLEAQNISLAEVLERRCVIMRGVLSELRKFRDMFLSRADQEIDGTTNRYYDIHQRIAKSELPY